MNLRLVSNPLRHCLLFSSLLLVQAILVLLLSPQPAAAGDKDKQITHVFALKYHTARETAVVIKDLYKEQIGPKGSMVITIDERTNSLIVKGVQEQIFDIAKLLQSIDTPAAEAPGNQPEVHLFRLHHADPALVEDALRLIFPAKDAGRFFVEREQRLVVIYSRGELLNVAKALLSRLDEAPPAGLSNLEFQVRVVWLSGASADDKLAKLLPKEFETLEADLVKLGLDRPSVARQLMARFTPKQPFEIGGDGPAGSTWTVSGRLSDQAMLDLTLTVSDKSAKAKPGVLLRTQVKLTSDRIMLVGAAPTGPVMSAFAVQITAPVAPGPVKKVGAAAGKPWATALEWLSDQTGLAIVATTKPTGTCAIPLPTKKLSTADAIDLLNEALIVQHYLLVRGERTIVLVPSDEKIDPALVPRIELADLDKRGKTELVSVTLSVKGLAAEDLAPGIKKMMSEFGTVVVLPKANRLVVQDTAGNIRLIVRLLKEIEEKKGK
jgi:type II secretory pathway component GspD/PulD (secretin)